MPTHDNPTDSLLSQYFEAMQNQAKELDCLAYKFLEETGLKASEVELVQEFNKIGYVLYFRKRKK